MAGPPFDLWLDWNTDFVVTPSGDLQVASGWDLTRQRIIRRAITNPAVELPDGTTSPPDYVYDPAYGFGLAKKVGQLFEPAYEAATERLMAQAILADSDTSVVNTSTPPSIAFLRPTPAETWIIANVPLITGQPGQLALKAS